MLVLERIKRSDSRILAHMAVHYSQPKGFVGRNICYAVLWNNVLYGTIAGGSACKFLPGRNEFFGIDKNNLNGIINNIFYHVEKVNGSYPCRWFTVKVPNAFMDQIILDWQNKYGDAVVGFESLVELPRTGQLYLKAGWVCVGQTKGYTCKRGAGKGTDSWGGKRVWDTKNLRPKLVFCKKT